MVVRNAETKDLRAILDIVSGEIREGVAHFGLVPPTPAELRAEFNAAGEVGPTGMSRYPWVVAEESGGRVVGYAKAYAWKPRGAYVWTAEIGVYVRPELQGRGVGRSLYEELFPRLEAAGLRTLVAGIALPNPASVKLHEAFGMKHVGTLPRMGFKHGAWRDVGYWWRSFCGEEVPVGLTERVSS